MLVTSIFSFSDNVFSALSDRNHHLIEIWFVICKYFQAGRVNNFVVLGRVISVIWLSHSSWTLDYVIVSSSLLFVS